MNIENDLLDMNLTLNSMNKELKEKNLELYKENERLGNELQVQIEDNVRLNEYIEEKGKEIERLNNIIKQQDTRNSRQRIANRELLERNQDLVIENLKSNNIINEFEKWLEAHLDDELYWFKMYDKLQVLKGSDKE